MLFFINNNIYYLQTSNCVQHLSSNLSKLVAKLINNNINLLNVSKSYIVKTKERVKNRKNTIIRTKKTKIKSIKRDLFDFKYIDAIIKLLRNNKDAIEKKNCNKAKQRKQKKNQKLILSLQLIQIHKLLIKI